MEKLVLIDGNSLINRAFYATPILSTKDGIYTNAVYSFMNMFFKMLNDVKPDYVTVAFDVKAPTFRHEMFEGYKGTRKPMPEELRPQIPLLKEILTIMGVHIAEKAGIEADDIIGTIAKHTKIETYIFTGDKDSFQLVDDETRVCFTRRGISDVEEYTAQNFTEKTGLIPSQIIELKALMGDASDNIPGIAGVGEKTAITLLQEFGTVDNLYANVDKLKGKLKEKIENGKESAYLSKTLATINTDCDVDVNTENMRVKKTFPLSLKQKFVSLELKNLYSKTDIFDKETEETLSVTDAAKTEEKTQVLVVQDLSEIQSIKNSYLTIALTQKAFDLYLDGKEYILPIKETLFDEGFTLSQILNAIYPLLNSNDVLTYDKKELRHLLASACLFDNFTADDLSIMKYLADFSGRSETLLDVITVYGEDEKLPAKSLYNVSLKLKEKLVNENMLSLYQELELPLVDVLFSMERSGFKADANALTLAGARYSNLISNIEKQIKEIAEDETLNVNSPKQIGDLIFEKLKLGKGKKTKHGYSTSADILESLENAHPVISLILSHRKMQKIYSTYIEGFKPLIDKTTGLIHTSFNQTVTSTGRLSSKEPNLQNIPVRDEEGKELRKFFVPRSEDNILISADYSQIELRLLASFSGCQTLIDAFNSGRDIHTQTASQVFNVDIKDVTPSMRSKAKAVNFGIIYGISEYGLAKNLKISPAEARGYINSYFLTYPEVKKYMNDNVEFARKNGYAITAFKRRRYIREINSSNFTLRQFGERAAMNMPLQGTAADVIKKAMLGVERCLRENGLKSRLILQIHDELIIDTLAEEAERVEKLLVQEMENAVSYPVKLTVSVGKGKTWFDAK